MSEQLSNKGLMKELRRELRQRQTEAEAVLWEVLRGRRLANTKFRRQHSFGNFIVDFYCAEHKLIIEVDGSVHNRPEARINDAEREAALCDLGLTMMRFTNNDVLYNMDKVLQKIRENLYESDLSPLSPFGRGAGGEGTIPQRLAADCQGFVDIANDLSEEQFIYQPGGKWSVADVMQHLYLSARPVVRLMTGPREIMLQWGKPTTPSRDYDTLASRYEQVLTTGLKAPAMFTPRPEDMQMPKSMVVERFAGVYLALIDAIKNWSDDELDDYVMPHPALGKLTVREMLYFTSIHTQHHLNLLVTK